MVRASGVTGVAVERGDGGVPGGEDGQLVVGQREDLRGVADEGGDVRGQERGAVVLQPEDERGRAAGADDGVGLVGVDDGDGERAAHRPEHAPGGLGQVDAGVVGEMLLDQVGHDLGVGGGGEGVALGLQVGLELEVVLDDPVVDEGEAAGAVDVGVGVVVRRVAVGGPAGVPDGGRVVPAPARPRSGWRARPPGRGGDAGDRLGPGLAGPPDLAVGHQRPRRPSRSRGTRAGAAHRAGGGGRRPRR